MSFANILSHSVACLFSLLTLSFVVQKLFILMESSLSIISLMDCASGVVFYFLIYLVIYFWLRIFKKIYLVIYFWLRWVLIAACGLSLAAVSRGYSSLWCTGFSLQWLLLLWSMGSRCAGISSCSMRAQ